MSAIPWWLGLPIVCFLVVPGVIALTRTFNELADDLGEGLACVTEKIVNWAIDSIASDMLEVLEKSEYVEQLKPKGTELR